MSYFNDVSGQRVTGVLWLLLFALLMPVSLLAEPYLAVRTGQKCMACHINPTGGGLRTAYGAIYGKTQLPAVVSNAISKTADFNDQITVGMNLRANYQLIDTPNQDQSNAFETERASLYMLVKPDNERLWLYLDEQFSPAAYNREAYALLWNTQQSLYLKAGRMFLPYGLRLEDDTAFIRQVSGINFSNSDDGIEAGLEQGTWSSQLAITNGSNGGAETNTGKQYSFRLAYVQPTWRIGGSINLNDAEANSDRVMQNMFAGLNWWQMEWLTEAAIITDVDDINGDHEQRVALFEINKLLMTGHNVKLTLEYYDPDVNISENHRNRRSLVYEHTPVSNLQLRYGLRLNQGIPQNDQQNADELFVQLHVWL